MFKRLLVPLDGSSLAEAVLPATVYLAQILGASVTLIHIIERNAPPEIHGDRHLTNPTDAQDYLQTVTQRIFPAGIRVEQHVHSSQVSDVARTITEHVSEFASDLIIMCTHGHGGLRAWLFGSIAQQVISLGVTPILLIQPAQSGTAPSFACRQLLVPLDGDPDHEQALPVAMGLAQICGAKIHLVMVVPTLPTLPKEQAAAAKLLPSTTTALLNLTQQKAEAYLTGWVTQLQAAGLLVTAQVSRGDPATTIAQTRQQIRADLVVLGTHGKKGADAFWSESVAPKLTSRFNQPLLLVPVHR
jgi:nucleotide-binding universal stress UspA family protein